MEGKEEDVRLGANRYSERQPIGTAAQQGSDDRDYTEPPPAPLFEAEGLTSWSLLPRRHRRARGGHLPLPLHQRADAVVGA
jgi:hypothetical protein